MEGHLGNSQLKAEKALSGQGRNLAELALL